MREVKVSHTIDLRHVLISSLIMRNLLDQLQLYIATGSVQNLFARSPSSFAIFCPLLARASVNFSARHHTVSCAVDRQRVVVILTLGMKVGSGATAMQVSTTAGRITVGEGDRVERLMEPLQTLLAPS